MGESGLLSVCAIAFTAVMLLLGLQALVIRLIVQLFPVRATDAELIAEAIQRAVESRFPGAKVVTVEELKPAERGSRAAH